MKKSFSFIIFPLFLLFLCCYVQAYSSQEQGDQDSIFNRPPIGGSESAAAAFQQEKMLQEWQERNERDRMELEDDYNNDIKPEHNSLKERYENDDVFNLGVNCTAVVLIMAFFLSLFASFVGLSQKAIWFYIGVVVISNVLWISLFVSTGDPYGINGFIVSFIVGLICFFVVQFNNSQ